MSARKPKIPYPWDWYSDKVQWMAMDKDGDVCGYDFKPQLPNDYDIENGIKNLWLTADRDHIITIESPNAFVWIEQYCKDHNIPWHETLRRRPRSRKG